jgi:hypothetical protein
MLAGLVDSLCLSFGWTVLMLQVVEAHGLGAAGVLSAAMLSGVALSAPVATRLARWLDGRGLLRGAASVESVLRVAVFILLVADAPTFVLACCVCAMNVMAWTGYAGMRAEVSAVSPGTAALTWYGAGVAAIEAVGAAAAALLPLIADVDSKTVLTIVTGVYVLGLLPTVIVAGGSPVARAGSVRAAPRPCSRRPAVSLPMLAGVVLMFAASAPTLLSVGLAAELHGRSSVALAAVAFTAGSLLAPGIATLVQRRTANGPIVWLLCAFGMVVGWVAAPWSLGMLFLAQAASGLFMTSLEGLLDTSAASRAGSAVTGALARATAGRAMGSAAATALFPLALASTGLTPSSAYLAVGLLVILLVVRSLGRAKIDTTSPVGEDPPREPVPTVGVGIATAVPPTIR